MRKSYVIQYCSLAVAIASLIRAISSSLRAGSEKRARWASALTLILGPALQIAATSLSTFD
jgi:hypothetical protein